MKLKKILNTGILTITLVLFLILLSSPGSDMIRFSGFLIVIWYNWETHKLLKGTTSKFRMINLIAATLTILFSLLLLFWTFEMFQRSEEVKSQTKNLMYFWIIVYGAYAILIAVFTLMTFKLHRARQA